MQGKATIGVMAKAIRTDRERSGVAGDAIRADIKFRNLHQRPGTRGAAAGIGQGPVRDPGEAARDPAGA